MAKVMNYIYCSRIDGISREQIYLQRRLLNNVQRIALDQYRFDDDKRRTLLGKMLLRYALKKHEGYQSSHFPDLHYNRYGKPDIMGMKGGFNISHADDWAVCAYSTQGDIGVDIEKRTPIDIREYKDVLTTDEFASLNRDSDVDFFRLWTLKEAIIKADGRGFYLSPTSFTLPHLLVNNTGIKVAGKYWYLYSQDIESEYVLSVASTSYRTALFQIDDKMALGLNM